MSATTPFVLVSGDFVTTGGMDRANYALATYLARQGNPVHLVTHRAAPELRDLPGVTAHRVPKLLGSYFLSEPLLDLVGRRVATRQLRAGGRAVVNGGNCRVADVNWVHYVHAAYRPEVAGSRVRRLRARLEYPLRLRAERAALRMARVIVCNSDLTRRQAIELCGADAARAVTVYYGADPSRFYPASDAERGALREKFGWHPGRPVVVFIGALGDRRKGFDTLFAAWTRLCASADWDANLVVVGSGAERPAWESRAAAVGLARRVEFLGFRGDVPDLLRAADLLVAPTRYEAYGLGVQEALCCGLPALVSATAGVAERYPPDLAGLLLPDPNDADDLTARLRHWRDHQPASRSGIRGLSEQLRTFTWDDMSRRFLEVCG